MSKLLAFSGSLRKGSFNQSIVKVAAKAAQEAGATVQVVDLSDYIAPIFNEDDEAASGMPEKARAFKELMLEADGFLIASPEYNSAYSAALKNVIDWASRKEDGEKPLEAFKGKTATLMAASPSGLGGLRGLVSLRMLLGNLGMHVHPTQHAISGADKLINDDGEVTDKDTIKKLENLGEAAVTFTKALA